MTAKLTAVIAAIVAAGCGRSEPPVEEKIELSGFETVEGDDLSMLPASVFVKNDNPVRDNMSLLPSGWNDGE